MLGVDVASLILTRSMSLVTKHTAGQWKSTFVQSTRQIVKRLMNRVLAWHDGVVLEEETDLGEAS